MVPAFPLDMSLAGDLGDIVAVPLCRVVGLRRFRSDGRVDADTNHHGESAGAVPHETAQGHR